MRPPVSKPNKFKIALVALLFAAVGATLIYQSSASEELPADINSDGIVNMQDLSILFTNWGRTGPSTPGPTPPPPPPPNPPVGNVQYPADLFEKNERWKITIPETSGGKVVEIKPPAFATYRSKYFDLNESKTAAVFKVWHGGGTTSGSSYPRSELRERIDNDPEGYWSCASGNHSMIVRGRVNRLTKVKPHTVIAQIHGGGDDVTVFRVEGNKLWLTNGDGKLKEIDSDFKLRTDYEIGFVVSGGTITYKYKGQTVSGASIKSSDDSCYFKVGAYLQSNPEKAPGESTSEYTEVEVYSAKVTHN